MQQHAEGAPAEASPDNVGSPASSADQAAAGKVAYPMRPIGVLESCFSQRSGTPRQPLLVPAARARLRLRSALHLPRRDCLALLSPYPLPLLMIQGHLCLGSVLVHATLQMLCACPFTSQCMDSAVCAQHAVRASAGARHRSQPVLRAPGLAVHQAWSCTRLLRLPSIKPPRLKPGSGPLSKPAWTASIT